MKRLFLFAATAIFLSACHTVHDYDKIFKDPNIYCATVHQLNTVVMGNNFSPMVASRNYLYAAVAGYEVIAGGYPDKWQSLAGQVRGLTSVPKPAAGEPVDFELASLLAYCKLGEAVTFPIGSMTDYVDSLKKLATDHGMPGDSLEGSIKYADTVAAAIMAWSKADNYQKTRGASGIHGQRLTRTLGTYPAGLQFGHGAPLERYPLSRHGQRNEFMPPPPYQFDVKNMKSPYCREVLKCEHKVDSLNKEETWIADFWDDNPFKLNVSGHLMYGTKKFSPAGHWMGVVGIAAQKAGADFPTTVAAYAKTSIALFDAFIQCWNIKYIYNTLRPETAINKYFDANWRPHLQTPPFPEYTCGHCTISAAAAETLTSVLRRSLSLHGHHGIGVRHPKPFLFLFPRCGHRDRAFAFLRRHSLRIFHDRQPQDGHRNWRTRRAAPASQKITPITS